MTTGTRSTEAVCRPCWHRAKGPIEPRAVLRGADPERCCMCGRTTTDGIYVKADTSKVRYPRAQSAAHGVAS